MKLRVSGLYRAGEHVFPSGQLPLVQLVGDWLAAAGFPVGARVAVESVEDGRLVLTRVDEAVEEPARWPERWAAEEAATEDLEREAVHA
ncbi:MAG TPA: SymE family type I addiction module toxin [Thermoanaerobaculia bacterium]|nr:SymE family type I addiction module toxin [Thermoanaerobaculia bacterium]